MPTFVRVLPLAAALTLTATHAFAQDGSVTVLEVSAEDGLDSIATDLYNAIRTQSEQHPDITLNDVPAQPLDDLLLAVGCTQLDQACSETLSDILGSDMLAWGSVSQDGSGVVAELTLWDLVEGRMVVESVQAAPSAPAMTEALSVIARSIYYVGEGSLSVASSPEGATITLDGEVVGTTPTELGDLELGFHHIELEADGYRPVQDTVVVDLGGSVENYSLAREVDTSAVAEPDPRTRGGGPDMGVISLGIMGAGLAIVGVGAYQGVSMIQTQNDYDELADRANAGDIAAREEAIDLQDQGESQAVTANLLYGLGGVTMAAGAVLYVLDMNSDNAESDEGASLRILPAFGRGSAGVSLQGRF